MKKINIKTTDMTEEEKVIKKAKRVGFIKKVVLVVIGFIVGLFVGKATKKDKDIDITIEENEAE